MYHLICPIIHSNFRRRHLKDTFLRSFSSFAFKMLSRVGVLCIFTLSVVSSVPVLNETYALDFFRKFGYINDSVNALNDLETTLIAFQEKYNLPVDGTLNEETYSLMMRPRCTQRENNFRIQSRWNKTQLYWYFAGVNSSIQNLAKKAFHIWEENSNLRFMQIKNPSRFKPDITISFGRKAHKFRADCEGKRSCTFPFDGPGRVLAHGYFPASDNHCVEIHIDADETWDYSDSGRSEEGSTNFLMTLVHEIGHTLGLGHSDTEEAIMYPWYHASVVPLHEDDIIAMEALYGQKRKYAPIPTTTTTTTTTTQRPRPTYHFTPTIKPTRVKNLCDIKSPSILFLAYAAPFPNYRLYVGHEELLWKFDLNGMSIPSNPEYISSYLPKELKPMAISHIFQDSAENLVAYSAKSHRLYTASFPDLNIVDDFELHLSPNAFVNAIFQTNSGRTFVFYDNSSYLEFIENPMEVMSRGRISDKFPGIPQHVTSAFKFTDGNIYFFNQDTYYKYSEYKKRVLAAGPFNWNLFNIPCPNESIIYQLKSLLTQVISFYQ